MTKQMPVTPGPCRSLRPWWRGISTESLIDARAEYIDKAPDLLASVIDEITLEIAYRTGDES